MGRIMIVEDMAMIALSLQDMIEDLGHDVVAVAGSIESAIRKVSDMSPSPDAVLLDANLRGQSAAPVAERLRELAIPFVIASGYGDETLDRVGRAEPRLRKPFTKEQLSRALDMLLGG